MTSYSNNTQQLNIGPSEGTHIYSELDIEIALAFASEGRIFPNLVGY